MRIRRWEVYSHIDTTENLAGIVRHEGTPIGTTLRAMGIDPVSENVIRRCLTERGAQGWVKLLQAQINPYPGTLSYRMRKVS